MTNRLYSSDPAYAVLMKWQAVGIIPELNAVGDGIVVRNCTWPEPGTDQPPSEVPTEAIEELGEYYDEILSHLRYWKQTRDLWERIHQQHEFSDAYKKGQADTQVGSPEPK